MTENMSLISFLDDIRITALLEQHPFFWIKKKCTPGV